MASAGSDQNGNFVSRTDAVLDGNEYELVASTSAAVERASCGIRVADRCVASEERIARTNGQALSHLQQTFELMATFEQLNVTVSGGPVVTPRREKLLAAFSAPLGAKTPHILTSDYTKASDYTRAAGGYSYGKGASGLQGCTEEDRG